MLSIALLHRDFETEKLEEVKAIMAAKGQPTIRAIWSESYGLWLAIEGCHRLRAAQELGLTPIIKDISSQKTVSYQSDGETVKLTRIDLLMMLNDGAGKTAILDFEDEN